ncbi:hypothetical protein M404DRAFT_28305 [Pisolithus tinctorius Marx 270]|uniref:Uncharacterized protein n=1 Tax=Pisolithus tinctorius Marx 270 TaxID=870435 RepID=A0A0C3JWL6_PISTI|nr:hypothetical protein M404DRAFT_28305 [Pisolithus tinctorius Marx 270]
MQLDAGRGGGRTLTEESRDGKLLRGEEEEGEAGGEDEEEPATLHKGPLGVGVSSWWVEWEQEWQLQAAERYGEAHEKAATAFERMARAAEQMAEAAEQTANEWAEWAEMRRREDACKARMAKFARTGGGWKRPQSEVAEGRDNEVDEGAEGDNKEEEEVGGEQEGEEEQEGGREQVMEE